MPANEQSRGLRAAVMRLLRTLTGWARRRGARSRAPLDGFMHMSDRMLADIGVRRADLHAAISGVVPMEHIARTHGGAAWTAQVHDLRPQAGRRNGSVGEDLDVAA
jgi:uncharacterized protein YjiS (DUF1127 family)